MMNQRVSMQKRGTLWASLLLLAFTTLGCGDDDVQSAVDALGEGSDRSSESEVTDGTSADDTVTEMGTDTGTLDSDTEQEMETDTATTDKEADSETDSSPDTEMKNPELWEGNCYSEYGWYELRKCLMIQWGEDGIYQAVQRTKVPNTCEDIPECDNPPSGWIELEHISTNGEHLTLFSKQLTDPSKEPILFYDVSFDGSHFVFADKTTIYVMSSENDVVASFGREAMEELILSPDGTLGLSRDCEVGGCRLALIRLIDGTTTELFNGEDRRIDVGFVEWALDGQRIAFVGIDRDSNSERIYVLNLNENTELSFPAISPSVLAWSADSQSIRYWDYDECKGCPEYSMYEIAAQEGESRNLVMPEIGILSPDGTQLLRIESISSQAHGIDYNFMIGWWLTDLDTNTRLMEQSFAGDTWCGP